MGNFLYKLFWNDETLPTPPPPPIFLLEDLKPNKSGWSFYKKNEKKEKKQFDYDDLPYPKF